MHRRLKAGLRRYRGWMAGEDIRPPGVEGRSERWREIDEAIDHAARRTRRRALVLVCMLAIGSLAIGLDTATDTVGDWRAWLAFLAAAPLNLTAIGFAILSVTDHREEHACRKILWAIGLVTAGATIMLVTAGQQQPGG